MNKTQSISAISIITAVMIIGIVSPAMANNAVDPCEKASPNAKGCSNSPNSTSTDTCDNCRAENQERNLACIEEFGNTIEAFFCLTESHEELKKCIKPVAKTCQLPPPPSP